MAENKKHPTKASKKGFLSFFGSNKSKNTTKDSTTPPIENQTDPEPTKQTTKDFSEKPTREKAEASIGTSHSDIKSRLEEAITNLSNEYEQKVASATNAAHSDIEKKIEESLTRLSSAFDQKIENSINTLRSDIEKEKEESLTRLSNAFDQKIGDTINALRSGTEDKIEENTTKLLYELDEKIKLKIDNISSSLRNEYRKHAEELLKTSRSTTLANRMYVIGIGIGSAFVVVIIILSLIGYSKIKETANDTVMAEMQRQANMEATKYATKDYTDTLIKEKSESAINELRQELNSRLDERADKIFGKSEKKIGLKKNRVLADLQGEDRKQTEAPSHTTKREDSVESLPVNSSKESDEAATNKQAQIAPDRTITTLLDYDEVLTKKKAEREYIFEGRHKEGFSEHSNENHPSSITYLSDTIRLNPENQYAYLNRGDAYYSLKQYKKAIEDYNKTIELDPENVIAYGRKGDAYGRLKQYKNSIINYAKAIELDPEYAPAYNNRANILFTTRQYEKAIKDYSKTIELDPENDTVYSNRGLAYSGLEQYEKASADYNKAIELAPEDAYHYVYLSKIDIFTGNYDSALAAITKALALSNNKETKALAIYIDCIVKKLLGADTSLSERELDQILKSNFTVWWDFSKLDSWLENADIDDETKSFIKEKSRLLATHLG
ncbi:MAG: tetratricopeptide repeat protein [Candidatus Scalindua sp.]|jgi:tetratricopeptide (TPR) repeat protein|nr:tetratricopeptide repeat protein [Candidatus Scalindua sp.]MDV5165402.1 tetratricopeptide repeat protein [Candidatus Scalindua sp.]